MNMITYDDYNKFIQLYNKGYMIKDIQRIMGITQSKYYKIYRKALTEKKIKARGKGRRPRYNIPYNISKAKDYSLLFNQLNKIYDNKLLALIKNKETLKLELITKQ